MIFHLGTLMPSARDGPRLQLGGGVHSICRAPVARRPAIRCDAVSGAKSDICPTRGTRWTKFRLYTRRFSDQCPTRHILQEILTRTGTLAPTCSWVREPGTDSACCIAHATAENRARYPRKRLLGDEDNASIVPKIQPDALIVPRAPSPASTRLTDCLFPVHICCVPATAEPQSGYLTSPHNCSREMHRVDRSAPGVKREPSCCVRFGTLIKIARSPYGDKDLMVRRLLRKACTGCSGYCLCNPRNCPIPKQAED
jgi:hypothetical protein